MALTFVSSAMSSEHALGAREWCFMVGARRLLTPLLVLTAVMFASAPVVIAEAPYESSMLLLQKIMYFHVASWIALTAAISACGVASALYLFRGSAVADHCAVAGAELTVLFGLCGLVTGSLWARKAWGVWWEWDPRLTMALMLELVFISYLLVRTYGGPGAEKLAAGMGIFGAVTAPFIYKSVDWWRTIHPKTSVIPTLEPSMYQPFLFCTLAFLLLVALLLFTRVGLESQRDEIDRLYLAEGD
jgi:heme exporter protein C